MRLSPSARYASCLPRLISLLNVFAKPAFSVLEVFFPLLPLLLPLLWTDDEPPDLQDENDIREAHFCRYAPLPPLELLPMPMLDETSESDGNDIAVNFLGSMTIGSLQRDNPCRGPCEAYITASGSFASLRFGSLTFEFLLGGCSRSVSSSLK